MQRWVIIIVIIGMLGWTGWEFYSNQKESKEMQVEQNIKDDGTSEVDLSEFDVGVEKGDVAPDFELDLMDGGSVKLSDFRGEKVMLNFWATWCPPCRAEMPDMQKLHENKDVTILAVDLLETEKEQGTDLVEEFIETYGITFNVLLDEKSVVSNEYGIKPIPTTYMIDTKGIIQNAAYGALNYEQMVQELDNMD